MSSRDELREAALGAALKVVREYGERYGWKHWTVEALTYDATNAVLAVLDQQGWPDSYAKGYAAASTAVVDLARERDNFREAWQDDHDLRIVGFACRGFGCNRVHTADEVVDHSRPLFRVAGPLVVRCSDCFGTGNAADKNYGMSCKRCAGTGRVTTAGED